MYKRVNKNHLAAEYKSKLGKREKTTELPVAVLFVSPKNLTASETQDIDEQFLSSLPNAQLLSYNNINNQNRATRFKSIFTYLHFLKKYVEHQKKHSHIHLCHHSNVSFLWQIVPLLIIAKFFAKKIVLDWQNFSEYYRLEESGAALRRILRMADAVITQSNYQSRLLLKYAVPAVTVPIRQSYDISNVHTITEVQPKILVKAHLEEIFNFDCIVKALQLVKQKYPRTELLISGEGSNRESIKNTIDRLSFGGISLAENQSEEIQDFDLFLNCYRVEYFSTAMLNAMAIGIPVISSPVGMISNLIMRENILFYQFNDHSTLADLLLELIETPELVKKLSENGTAYVKKYITEFEPKQRKQFYQNLS